MRVAQLIETLAAGGAEALAVQIANTWSERGHDSHLIVLSSEGPFREKLSPTVGFHHLGLPTSGRSSLRRLPAFVRAGAQLRRVLSENGIEAIQTHLPLANFFGLVQGLSGSCRVYPTAHNNREFDYGDASGPIRESLRRFAYRQMLTYCRRMIAVSDQVKNSMVAELGLPDARTDRIAVVPNGVPIPDLLTGNQREEVRRKYGVGMDEIMVVGVGRLTRQKNFKDLIQALSAVEHSFDRWRCVVAGEGELRKDLIHRSEVAGLAAKISFPGHVADVRGLLGAADVFCLPSIYEGLPLVLLEAMAAGLPIAAYAIDGVTDVVTDEVEASLAEPENTRHLAAALLGLLSEGTKRQRMGQAAQELVTRKYSFEHVADLLEKVCAV